MAAAAMELVEQVGKFKGMDGWMDEDDDSSLMIEA